MNIEIIILLKIVNAVNCLCAICTKQTYDNVSVHIHLANRTLLVYTCSINLANVCQELFSGSCTEKRAH